MSDVHVVDYYIKMVRSAGPFPQCVHFVLPDRPEAAKRIEGLLKNQSIDPDNYAVFIPGSAHAEKCWPAENFASLAEKIHSEFGLRIIAAGTKSEKQIALKLQQLSKVPVFDFCGQTSILELVSLLRGAKLVVSNDTGPGHIAAALNIPLVLIFGQVNPARLEPYGRPETVAAIDPETRGLEIRDNNPAHSVKAISLRQVYQSICEQVENAKAKPA